MGEEGGRPERPDDAAAAREPDPIALAREEARILASSVSAETDAPEDTAVARTVVKLRKSKPEPPSTLIAVEAPGMIKTSIAPASIDRFALAMNRLAAALSSVGARLGKGEKAAVIICDGERIGFSVTEGLRREKHVPTEQEKAEDEARRKRRSRLSNPWDDELDIAVSFLRRAEWDYHPTGRLSLELEASYLRIRREEEARRRDEGRRLRDEALRARHVEERRGAALDAVLDELAGLDRLRRLVDALRAHLAGSASPRAAVLLETAERRLAELAAALSPDGLERRFSDRRLFGDDDDHGFTPPAHYY